MVIYKNPAATCYSVCAMNLEKLKTYLKGLGIAGFLFFLIKGLLWLFILFFIKSKL